MSTVSKPISIVIRTYNESRYLNALLEGIASQKGLAGPPEVVLVDSGSTDSTLEIAEAHDVHIVHIEKESFSFGRSLNIGCSAASGEVLVFVSGHCVPVDDMWLHHLTAPIDQDLCVYSYGRQLGGGKTKFSEHQVFDKYFPGQSAVPQKGFFCNNANAALSRDIWQQFSFDEELLGLEDMDLGKRLNSEGHHLAYVAEAGVYHHHNETWSQVRRRYEREAIALQKIMPDVQVHITDFLRFFGSGVSHDLRQAYRKKKFWDSIYSILMFRFCQFFGAYRGNHTHRRLSRERKLRYFYPNPGNSMQNPASKHTGSDEQASVNGGSGT